MLPTTWLPRNRRFARPACLTLSLLASLSVCSACGHQAAAPALARADAQPLIVLARRIAAEDACTQRRDIQTLQARTVALVNAGRVPAKLQDTLVSGVNALAADTPPCVPKVPVATPPPTPTPPDHGKGHEKHHGHPDHGNGQDGGD